jgi:hypothetical protein
MERHGIAVDQWVGTCEAIQENPDLFQFRFQTQ